jgi:hypothetical protein
MPRIPSARSRGLLGLGACLFLLARLGAQEPQRQPGPGPQGPAAQKREAEVQVERAELQALAARLQADLDAKRAEVQTAEERLRAVRQRLERVELQAQGRAVGSANVEQRLQQLEAKVDLLVREIQALRGQPQAQQTARRRLTFLDLQAKANHKRADDFHSGRYPGNNLASLPAGEQTLGGVKFHIGEGVLQLGSSTIADKPEKVEGIPVGRRVAKLYILHATGYSPEEEEKRIGAYTVHYQDGTTATIPVVYGQDVMDWWKYPGAADPTRAKVAWEGKNEPAKNEFDATIRLYLTTWENPHPEKAVATIDYASTMDTPCAPFCVAITAEEP